MSLKDELESAANAQRHNKSENMFDETKEPQNAQPWELRGAVAYVSNNAYWRDISTGSWVRGPRKIDTATRLIVANHVQPESYAKLFIGLKSVKNVDFSDYDDCY